MYQNIPDDSFHNWISSYFKYDEVNGLICALPRNYGANPTPRQKQWNVRFANKPIGYKTETGYIRVSLPNGKELYAHQIAFLLKTGSIPNEIDHKDNDGFNNKWSNLRKAEHGENVCNAKQRKTNKSKLKGVSWAKSNNCWRMDIQHKNKKYYSYHETKELAYAEYCRMSEKLHGKFSNVK